MHFEVDKSVIKRLFVRVNCQFSLVGLRRLLKVEVQNSSVVEASSPIEAKSNPLWRSVLIYPLWWSPLRQNTIRPLSQNIIRPFRQIIQLSLRQNIIQPLRQNIIRPLRQKQTSGPWWSPLSLNIIRLLRQNTMLLLLYM